MKVVAIDELVRWAYRIELPKEPMAQRGARFLRQSSFIAPWAALSKTGTMGTDIDEPDKRNRFGLFPDSAASAEPHPDAVKLWFAVQGMQTMRVSIPDEWDPLSDVAQVTTDVVGDLSLAVARAAGIARIFYPRPEPLVTSPNERQARKMRRPKVWLGLRRSVPDLIQKHAVLGGEPSWETEQPVRKWVRNSHGGPAWFREVDGLEVDGFDPKRRRPFPGAYQKSYFDPDLADIVEARAEYWVWVAAMGELVRLLGGGLDAHQVLPLAASSAPWATAGGVRQSRVIEAA